MMLVTYYNGAKSNYRLVGLAVINSYKLHQI